MIKAYGPMVTLVVMALLLGCGGGDGRDATTGSSSGSSGRGADFSPVLARVGDFEITQNYFDKRYDSLTPAGQSRFSGDNWRERFLDELIAETMVYQAAVADGFLNDPDVEARLEALRRNVLVAAYTNYIYSQATPTEQEILDHYELNTESYRNVGRVMVYEIRAASKEEADTAYSELQSGAGFAVVAAEYSQDPQTRNNEGFLSWVNEDGYVPGVGFDKQYTDIVFSLKQLEYTEPVEIQDSWRIIRVGQIVPGEQKSLEEVRDRVVEELRPRIAKRYYMENMGKLEETYEAQRYGEFATTAPQTDEQLYKLAAEASNVHAKVDFYDQLVLAYPKSPYADESMFMIGFLYSEEILDKAFAMFYLRKLVDEYPDSEYVDDARWLLRNLNRAQPGLREDAPLDDPDAVIERVGEVRGN